MITVKGTGAGWAGWEVQMRGKVGIKLSGENFYVTGKPQPGMWVPKEGSTTKLFIYKASNPNKMYRLDYHTLQNGDAPVWHNNKTKGLASIKSLSAIENHSVTPSTTLAGKSITIFKWGGRAMFVAGVGISAYDIYKANNKPREVVKQVGGWTGAILGAKGGAYGGAKGGAAFALIVGQMGPQVATPEELVTVPVAVTIGGIGGGIIGGITGWVVGSKTGEIAYDWIFTPTTKEEWIICGETSKNEK